MPVKVSFSKGKIMGAVEAAIMQAMLEITIRTQNEMQKMVSGRGQGKIYAKTAEGVRRLDRMLADDVGVSKANAARMAQGAAVHKAFKGSGRFDPTSVLNVSDATRRARTREFVARRVGVTMFDSDIRALQGKKRSLRDAGLHQASLPGDPPALDTGHLRRNIQVARTTKHKSPKGIGWRLTIAVAYAKWLEDGTKRMAARPFVRPSLRKIDPIAIGILRTRMRLAGVNFR